MDPQIHLNRNQNSSSPSSNEHDTSGIKPNDVKGVSVLLADLKSLQLEGTKSGDLIFFVGKEKSIIKAHTLVIKARCKNFKGESKLPSISKEIFTVFLTYVYTGKLDFGSLDQLYPLYLLSMEFGLEDLTSTCEDLIVSNLDKNWALSLLKETVETLQSDRTKIQTIDLHQIQRINDTVIAYLSDNYQSLKVHKAFLDLPVGTMTALLKSPNLCVEEEEVWRCVLRWAQHKASVETHLSQWTDDERHKVSQFLSPVISHVRLLLIDSRVFAEEVEPTGCVPMALSLERYRHAALSDSAVNNTDPRLTPRNAQKLFLSSLIINTERLTLGKKLVEWYNNITSSNGTLVTPVSNWKCVYRASLHGQSAEDFHRRVDGVGPTYTVAVLKNTKWVCGGFTDVPWSSTKSPKYFASNNSFLFAFSPATQSIRKFNVNKKHFAVCHDANSGPIFGAGADFYISSMCQSNSDSYSNLPHSYEFDTTSNGHHGDDQSSDQVLFTPSYHFSILDYEVFCPN